MKKKINYVGKVAFLISIFLPALVSASELTTPHLFSSGSVTSASDMNANFDAIKAAVNDNHARIEQIEQSQSRTVFVGFSEPISGTDCLGNVQLACHNLEEGSHMCTDYELTVAPYNPAAPIPTGDAWVSREIISIDSGTKSRIESCATQIPYHLQNNKFVTSSLVSTFPVACCK